MWIFKVIFYSGNRSLGLHLECIMYVYIYITCQEGKSYQIDIHILILSFSF